MVPALVMTLKRREADAEAPEDNAFSRGLRKLGAFSLRRRRPVAIGMVVALLVAGVGLTQIQINDSPVWWFKQGEDVREATEFLNDELGGTSMLYVVAEGNDDVMKEPETLRYLDDLQRHLEDQPDVGKTTSLADLVKRINEAWHDVNPEYFQIPESRQAVAQFLLLYLSSGRPSDLQDFVTHGSGYDKANVIVQLKDNGSAAMEDVVASTRNYLDSHQLEGVSFSFAGPGYFNARWNQEMFQGMMLALGSAALAVLLLLTLNFRSFKWGLVGFIPLGFTVLVTYGILALLGVEFTMPIEVISALTLGMAVDFAIHFVQRFRERYDHTHDLNDSILWTLGGSGVAILRNAVILFVGFLVLLFAPLTPYINVGVFIAIIMALSSMATLFLLPAIIRTFAPALVGEAQEEIQSTPKLEEVQP
jgi:predicted RND superfamily exporter protein